MNPIFLDYMSTHPVDRSCLNSYMKLTSEVYGNSQSIHLHGMAALDLVDEAKRTIIEDVLGADLEEWDILFTQNASQANAWALSLFNYGSTISSKAEHSSVLKHLESGTYHHLLDVDDKCQIKLSDVDKMRRPPKVGDHLLSFMSANNETGTKYDLAYINATLRDYLTAFGVKQEKIFFHSDMTCTLGKEILSLPNCPFLDMISFSGHKFGSLKGIGGLIYRKSRVNLATLNNSIGTIDAPRIYTMAELLLKRHEILVREVGNSGRGLAGVFLGELQRSGIEYTPVVPMDSNKLYNVINIRLHGVDSYDLLLNLDSVSISNGSACNSLDATPSHVLLAMGMSDQEARECIRISWDPYGDPSLQLEAAAKEIVKVANVLLE